MPFANLVWINVKGHLVRTSLTAVAIAIGIMSVVALGVLTHSLRQTAISILQTGSADFTVAQKGVSDVLNSSLDEDELNRIANAPGVETATGVLIDANELDDEHRFFLRLGILPDHLEEFGVQVIEGRAFERSAMDEIMLGYRAARDLDKAVGDEFEVDGDRFTIVGIYSTGQVFGDSASMLSLSALQAFERKPGNVTLAFVRVQPGADIDQVRAGIENALPEIATVRTESEFGRIDRNLELISAANVGATILALLIGAVSVSNTMMMSVFERTREFGILRALGWSRSRVLTLVLSESVLVAFMGACLGVLAGYAATRFLEGLPELQGIFQPEFTAEVFGRALVIAFGMALIGAFYPALRAAALTPLSALRHE